MPAISIICPTLNHEKYIAYFLDSCINQTFSDFELIIIDDGSTDRNVEIIKSYNDNRIKLYINEYNMGINATFLKGVSLATSDICVFMSSDDIFHVDYIKTILNCFNENNCDVVYTQAQLIDKNGLPQDTFLLNPFNLSFKDIFRTNFYNHHLSYIPGMAMKKSFISKASFHKGLLLYADLQLHIDALLYGKIFYDNHQLIYYRISDSNTSAYNEKFHHRTILETNMLMDTFLQIKDSSFIKDIFNDDLPDNLKNFDDDIIPFILGYLALKSNNCYRQQWGYTTIIKFYSDYNFNIGGGQSSNQNQKISNSEILYTKYGIEFKDIMNYIQPIIDNDPSKYYINKIEKIRKKRNIASILAVIFFIAFLITLLFLLI